MAAKAMRIECADDVFAIRVPPELSGYELVNGQLVAVSPVGADHGSIAVRVTTRLENHVNRRRTDGRVFVETGFVLGLAHDPERLRGPDVSFVRGPRLRAHGGLATRKFLRFAPDLAVEIESEARPRDMRERVQEYLEAGTQAVWVIDADHRTAAVYGPGSSVRRLGPGDSFEGGALLPGFSLPLTGLFQP
jgi:Uma2 family endonuclease